MVTRVRSQPVGASGTDHPEPHPLGRASRRNLAVVAGVCAALLGLTWAWAFATPMGGFPDDIDHYLRSVGVAEGQVLGEPNARLEGMAVPTAKGCCAGEGPAMAYWLQAGLRSVTVPGAVRPELIDCSIVASRPRYSCGALGPLEDTSADTLMGTIEPTGYLPSGVALALGSWGTDSFRVARLATSWLAVLAIGLVLAGCAARPRFGRRVIGLCIATTPMVVFVLASGSPSAVETGAAIAVWLAVLELTSTPTERAPRLLWVGFGVAAVLLVSARSLGPIWFVLVVAVALVLRGGRSIVDRVRTDRTPALIALGLTAAAAASTVLWEVVVQPEVSVDGSFAGSQFADSLANLSRIAREVIGWFGYLEIPLPSAVAIAWFVLIASAVVVGLVTGGGRARAALVLLVAAAFGMYLVLDLLVMRQNGFMAQGRHLLPVVVGVPILAVEIVRVPSPRWRGATQMLVAVGAGVCGALQVYAWAYAATSRAATPAGLVVAPAFGGTWSYANPVPLIVVVVAAAIALAASTAAVGFVAGGLVEPLPGATPDTS